MRARFTTDDIGRVTLAYDCAYTGERIIRIFTCPLGGGYVLEEFGNGQWGQVCDCLSGTGSTLWSRDRGRLLDVIRAEYRTMRQKERREMQEY